MIKSAEERKRDIRRRVKTSFKAHQVTPKLGVLGGKPALSKTEALTKATLLASLLSKSLGGSTPEIKATGVEFCAVSGVRLVPVVFLVDIRGKAAVKAGPNLTWMGELKVLEAGVNSNPRSLQGFMESLVS